MKPEKVVMIGGGGFVGSCLASRLSLRGMQIVVPTRRPEKRKSLTLLPGVRLVAADIHNELELAQSMAGADAVINLVGILHDRDSSKPYGRRFAAAHVELPEKIIAAMKTTGVRRLLHMSALRAASDAPSSYLRSKAAGEAVVLAAAGGLDVTLFRPSVIFGPGDAFLNTFAALLRTLPFLPLAGAKTRFQPVYVGDVAEAFMAALQEPGTSGKTYELCGPGVYSLRQLVEYTGRLIGCPRPVIDLPAPLARLQAALLGLLPNPPMSPDNLRSLQIDSVTDGHLDFPGWNPQSLEAIAPTYLTPFRSRLRLSDFRRRRAR